MAWRLRWPVAALAALALLGGPATATRAGRAPAAGGSIAGPSAAAGSAGTAEAEAGRRWWAHVRYLADDRLQGRLTGSAGYREAASYVAARFKEYGLAPAGTNGYFQPVRFEVLRVAAAESRLALARDGRAAALSLGRDALLSSRQPQPKELAAPLAFVGYALHLPEAGYDDFAGQDLRGKVVVYLNGGPGNIAGALKSHARAAQEFGKALERTGAVG
jgi:hypothetical protein